MTHAQPEAVAAPDLLTASSAAIGALAGAIDDLQRAGLILRQMASGASERIRGPEDCGLQSGRQCARRPGPG